MTDTYYHSVVLRVGPEVDEFRQGGVLIFFAEPVPDALASVSVIHQPSSDLQRPLAVGDVLVVDGSQLAIREVGELASDNLRSLGHMVLYADQVDTPLLPGAIKVSGSLPYPQPGQKIEIARGLGDQVEEREVDVDVRRRDVSV